MNASQFAAFIESQTQPVVLLEGTRALSEIDAPQLENFASQLAKRFPHVGFCSGNAPGSDQSFSCGVASEAVKPLEIVVPYARHRLQERPPGARVLSLDSLQNTAELTRLTLTASPNYAALSQNPSATARAKFGYLLRDTLKITGDENADFAPATVGIFFIDEAKPTTGGTAHTMRVTS